MIRPIDISVDASSFDDFLHLSPASVQILRDVVHNYLLNRFANAYESFPAPEEMEQIDRDLLKFESLLDRSLVRRGVKYYAQFKEQKL